MSQSAKLFSKKTTTKKDELHNEKKEIEIMKSKISELIKDKNIAKKAALIISNMISKK